MFDVKQFWKQVNDLTAHLKEQTNNADYVWIMSIENSLKGTTAGTVCAAEIKEAAKRLIEKTHRLATAEEVEAHKAKMTRLSDRMIAREQQRAARSTVVSPEQIAMLLRGQPILGPYAQQAPEPEKTAARSKQPAA